MCPTLLPESPCSGHGVCERNPLNTDYPNKRECYCHPAWRGRACELGNCPQSGPEDLVCGGHGICQHNNTGYVCLCDRGWGGTACNESTCPESCLHHGDCIEGVCHCLQGYSGARCEIVDRNCSNDCSGHGSCEVGSVCICESGFTGDDCATPGCPSSQNIECSGNGRCVNGTACECDPGWSGENCGTLVCPNNCNWNYTMPQGECLYDRCVCYPGYSGNDCSVHTALSQTTEVEQTTGEPCMEDPNTCAEGACSAFKFTYWSRRWDAAKRRYVRDVLNVTIGTGNVHPFQEEVLAALGHPLPPEEQEEEGRKARACYLKCVRELAVKCETDLQSLRGILRQRVMQRISQGNMYRGLTGDLVSDISEESSENTTAGEDFRVYDVAYQMRHNTATTELGGSEKSRDQQGDTFENSEYATTAQKEANSMVAHSGGGDLSRSFFNGRDQDDGR